MSCWGDGYRGFRVMHLWRSGARWSCHDSDGHGGTPLRRRSRDGNEAHPAACQRRLTWHALDDSQPYRRRCCVMYRMTSPTVCMRSAISAGIAAPNSSSSNIASSTVSRESAPSSPIGVSAEILSVTPPTLPANWRRNVASTCVASQTRWPQPGQGASPAGSENSSCAEVPQSGHLLGWPSGVRAEVFT